MFFFQADQGYAEIDKSEMNLYEVSKDANLSSYTAKDFVIENRMRTGETTVLVDVQKWEDTLKNSYKEQNPNYNGDVYIVPLEEYDPAKDISDYESDSLVEIIDNSLKGEEQSKLRSSTTTGPHVVQKSVGKAFVYYNDPKKPGYMIAAQGSVFKTTNSRVGTASHVIYDKQENPNGGGLGWASNGSICYDFQKDSQGNYYASAIYDIRTFHSNNDWIGSSSHTIGIRSDIGSITVGNVYGNVTPPNINLRSSAPASYIGAVSYGYKALSEPYLTRSYVDVRTSSLVSDWFGWVYETPAGYLFGGMSGGPLLDSQGYVIGVNSSGISSNGRETHDVYTKINSTFYNQLLQ